MFDWRVPKTCFMGENIGKITGFFKRKNRNSSSKLTEAELLSPKRSKRRIDSQDSVQSEDLIDSALNMAEGVGEKLDKILTKLTKLGEIENRIGGLNSSLEKLSDKLEREVNRLDNRLTNVEEKASDLELDVKFIDENVQFKKKGRNMLTRRRKR